MAHKIRLFRLTNPGDDENVLDRIDFNDPTNVNLKDAKRENAWITELERIRGDGIGDDQPAEEDLGSIDATGSTEDTYVLKGIISKRDGTLGNGQNQFLILLDLWDAEPKKWVNWPEGRFGIIDDGNHTNDLIPVGVGSSQVGLIWESYRTKTILKKNQEEVEIRFRISRGDGT